MSDADEEARPKARPGTEPESSAPETARRRRSPRHSRSSVRALFSHRPPSPQRTPGTFRTAPDAAPTQVSALAYDGRGVRELDPNTLSLPPSSAAGEATLWVDITGFRDEEAIRRIGQLFGIHPLALADGVNTPQRPKVEDYGGYRLLIVRAAHGGQNGEVELAQVSVFIGPGWVLTLQERPNGVLAPVRERIQTGVGPIRGMGPSYLACALLSAVVDGYFPVLDGQSELLDGLEEEVLERPTRETLQAIHRVRRSLLTLHRIHRQQRDALYQLVRWSEADFPPEVRPYVRDLYDHGLQVLDAVETARELVANLLEIYLSTLSNRMNEVMKTLTVIATIFIPLTFIAGVYGMNFRQMPELDWPWGYPAVWIVMIAVALGFAVWFRRRGWWGEGDD